MENTEIMTATDAGMLENVLVNGDLSRLSPTQRLDYYRQVCQSMGLNPLSRPFDYINLNGKLTLYAKKDATDQLRKIHGVSIDDIDIQEDKDGFTVKVKGHDNTGRSDVEIGCVAKTDMRGSIQNTKMKAVTKAKRRLTLSLCGLGWLDETEVETIPDAKPIIVDNRTGEIVGEKPAVEPQKKQFDEIAFLHDWSEKSTVIVGDAQIALPSISMEMACDIDTRNSDGTVVKMGKRGVSELAGMWKAYKTRLADPNANRDDVLMRLSAVNMILTSKANAQAQLEKAGA